MKKLKDFLLDCISNRKTLFELVVIMCALLNMVYLHTEIFKLDLFQYRNTHISHLFLIVDLLWIYLIPLCMARKRMSILLIVYLLHTLVIWINVGYSRYFDTYLPLTLYTAFNNLNGLSRNIVDAIELSDCWLALTTILVIFAYTVFCKSKRDERANGLYPIVLILCGCLYPGFYYVKDSLKEQKRLQDHFAELNDHRSLANVMWAQFQGTKVDSYKKAVFKYGMVNNLLYDAFSKHGKVKMPEALVPYIWQNSTVSYPLQHRNLIVILAESLSSYPIGQIIDGIELTPTLNRLVEEGVFHPRMCSETQLGESSDGQFTYMTGMLPLKNEVTINEVANNELITIPKLFKQADSTYHVKMVIPTDESSWSQATMCVKYGVDTLFSRNDYRGEAAEWLNDEQLFRLVAKTDEQAKSPFISFVLTSSTHSPYNKIYEDMSVQFPDSCSSELVTYLKNVHYMDKWLGWYMESLKEKQLYDSTTIIIMADHKPNTPKLNLKGNQSLCADLPFLVINSPVDFDLDSTEPIYQTSFFPTLLDMWGIKSTWRGVGESLLSVDSMNVSSEEKQKRHNLRQQLSDALIYSDFFATESKNNN